MLDSSLPSIKFAALDLLGGAVMNACCAPDYLSFAGSIIGAGAGIATAFLAVSLAQNAIDKRDLRTIRDLLSEFESRASEMHSLAQTNPAKGVREALVQYRATRDAAIGIRTRGAKAAKVAAILETNNIVSELQRLQDRGSDVQPPDVQAWAGEMQRLGQQLSAILAKGL